jgi:23S rRNA (adenine2503-C2)-methyltransferase
MVVNSPRAMDLIRGPDGRADLKSMTLAGLQGWVKSTGGGTPQQGLLLYKAIWQQGARELLEAPGVAKALLQRLEPHGYLSELGLAQKRTAQDGTVKFLWKLEDGQHIESVLIPDGKRLTLCMSSQVGCAMGCTFCLTASMGLVRHLKMSEIANQPLEVSRHLPPDVNITNLVLMGMGEPLHNLRALVPALEVVLDDHALNFSHRRVTVSTVGLVGNMHKLAEALPVNLAVSVNATTEAFRRSIMPITKKHSLESLRQACLDFPLPRGKRITFEYVMFAGENDTPEDAERLLKWIEGIPAKINLIPYNENPDRPFRAPSDDVVKAFQNHFVSRGVNCTIRATRGEDIQAACGQLATACTPGAC